jgi:ABC-2 type transport system permease protein
MMRKYWEMTRSQIKVDFAYSMWFWAGSFTTIMGMLIMYAFWHAVYQNHSVIAGMNLSTMLTYVVIAMLLGNYVAGVGGQLSQNIRDGSVAIELMRPYDLLHKLVALDLGRKVTGTIQNTLPMVVIAFVFLHINAPASVGGGFLFVPSALLGVLLGAQVDLITGIVAFWTVNAWGVRILRDAILMFFTGSLIPINLFPSWLQTLGQFLPFQSMVYIPVSIYTGRLTGMHAVTAVLVQLAWLVGVYVAIRLIWSVAIRKVTIFGG